MAAAVSAQKPSQKVQIKRVQVYGRKKTATALAVCKEGTGIIKVNGRPLKYVQPEVLREKAEEPIHLLGREYFKDLDIYIRVRGGGQTAQIYAVRQAIARGLIAFLQKYVDETRKAAVKSIILGYDRSLLVADPRLCEAKKFGGPGARARYQKSYR